MCLLFITLLGCPQSSDSSLLSNRVTASTHFSDSNIIQYSPLVQEDTVCTHFVDSYIVEGSPLDQKDSPSTHLYSESIQSSRLNRRVYKYDVFLSFKGTDTRNNFTDHLYDHLIRKGIFAFKDDKRLKIGESISPQLLQAIKDSRVSVVIFSSDYARSTWCLEEMAAIADCRNGFKQTVLPIFYDVDPSHVRNQIGPYKDAFASHRKKFKTNPRKVARWETAMTGFANLAGCDISMHINILPLLVYTFLT